jgi:hypothetical protein
LAAGLPLTAAFSRDGALLVLMLLLAPALPAADEEEAGVLLLLLLPPLPTREAAGAGSVGDTADADVDALPLASPGVCVAPGRPYLALRELSGMSSSSSSSSWQGATGFGAAAAAGRGAAGAATVVMAGSAAADDDEGGEAAGSAAAPEPRAAAEAVAEPHVTLLPTGAASCASAACARFCVAEAELTAGVAALALPDVDLADAAPLFPPDSDPLPTGLVTAGVAAALCEPAEGVAL